MFFFGNFPGQVSITSVKLRDVPKVKYLGNQGRPKHLKPGETDPHAEERMQIEQKLHAAAQGDANIMVVTESEMATLDQVCFEESTPIM